MGLVSNVILGVVMDSSFNNPWHSIGAITGVHSNIVKSFIGILQ